MAKSRWTVWRQPGLVVGLFLLAACSGPIETQKGEVNEDSASLMRVAASTRAAGDAVAAISLYQRAAKLVPENPEPLIGLGDTLNELGAYREASETWVKALYLVPDNVAALKGYGTALTGLNQPHLALVKFEAALALAPEPGIYNGLGVAHDMLGNADQAQANYRAGLLGAPADLGLVNNLGLSLALSGDYDEAIVLLERAVTLTGVTVRHRQNLALAYGLAGDGARAAQIGRLDLDEQRVRQNLGYYHVLRGMTDHAAKVAAVGSLGIPGVLATSADTPVLPPRRSAPRQGASKPLNGASLTGLATAPAGAEIPVIAKVPTAAGPSKVAGAPPQTLIRPASLAPDGEIWRVQIGALANRQGARAAWDQAQGLHDDLLGPLSLRLQQATVERGTFYRIQGGPLASLAAAQSLCAALEARDQSCLVVRP
ncbi:MAG: SPOR domain-containing protein [Alphaproteobacteria bacterium]